MRPAVELTHAPWRFPSPDVHRLANGMTVWHYPMPDQHVAAFELLQPIRLAQEPRDKEGVATIALHTLDEATQTHDDVQELLDRHGAALHATAHLYSTRFGGLVPARRFNEFLPLLVEVMREPSYHDADLAIHVEAQQAAYRTRKSSPGGAAKWAFRIGLYGTEQRHGRPVSGDLQTLDAITRDDVTAWHAAQFAPNDATLIVAGDLDSLDLQTLSAWTARAQRHEADAPRPEPPRFLLVDVPGAVQATIHVGCRSIARTDPRWPAARLAGHVLAGGFASRLNLELRERLGYTYGLSGGFSPDLNGSIMQLSTNVRTEVARETVKRILDALLLAHPVTAPELEDAKAYRIGIAPLANETSADIAAQAAALAECGLTTEFVNQHTDALRLVTPDEATVAWRELIRPESLTIAIAGNAQALEHQLQDLGAEVLDLP